MLSLVEEDKQFSFLFLRPFVVAFAFCYVKQSFNCVSSLELLVKTKLLVGITQARDSMRVDEISNVQSRLNVNSLERSHH